MSDDGRILRLENALATLAELSVNHERRLARLEDSFTTLVELTRSHNEGMDELRAAQAGTEHKLAALVDAQVRAEELLSQFRAAQEEGMSKIRAAQAETDRKLAVLVDAHIRTEDALARLTEEVNDMSQGGRGDQPAA